MKIDQSDYLPAAEVRLLDLRQVRHYLTSRDWKAMPGLGRGLVDVFERPEDRLAQVRIPAVNNLDDYDFVLARSLAIVAAWEKRPVRELYQDLLFFTEDVLHFTETGSGVSRGTLPFPRLHSLIAGIRHTLTAAVGSLLRPESSGVSLPEADQLLCRCGVGQTGSPAGFTLTLVCPLDAVPERVDEPLPGPFSRQVLTHLFAGLKVLREGADHQNVDAILQAHQSGSLLTADLCEGLLKLAPPEGGQLVLGMRWAVSLPLDEATFPPAEITLTHALVPFLNTLANRLNSDREVATR